MAAPSPSSRFAELVDMLKAEYERVSSENQSYKGIRNEWNRKVDEQTNELNAMLAEFRDLERKHQLVKEQYEAEIFRLKGQAQPSPSAQPSSLHPQPPSQLANSLSQKRRTQPTDTPQVTPFSSTIPPDHNLPDMFPSRPPTHHAHQRPNLPSPVVQQPSPHAQPGQPLQTQSVAPQAQPPQPSSQPPQPNGSQSIPSQPSASNQLQPTHATTQPMQVPQQTPVPIGINIFPSVPNAPTPNQAPIPSMSTAGNPPTMQRSQPPSLLGKMTSIALMPPNGTAAMRETNPFTQVPKKEGTMALGGPIGGPTLSTPGGNAFGAVTGRDGVMQLGGPQSHPNHGDDWAVYQGRSPNGSPVNMKVNLQHNLPLESVVCCVRYSWDGQFLATGSNRSAHVFEASSGQLVGTFSKDAASDRDDGGSGDSYVRAVCFSPDGNWLITGAEDHVVKVWDVRTRKVKHVLKGHVTDIYSVDCSKNGKFIISGSGDKKAKLWGLESGKLLNTLGEEDRGPTDGITSVSVSPSSKHVAAGSLDKIVRVWDVDTCRLVRQFEGHRDSVYSVAFSPDGRMVLSGSLDKTLKLWDLATNQPSNNCRLTFSGHKDFVLSVAFSPNGRWLISGSKDRSVQFWDPRQSSMCMMLQGHKNSVISIAHNPVNVAHDPGSKALATGSGDFRARTWVYSCR